MKIYVLIWKYISFISSSDEYKMLILKSSHAVNAECFEKLQFHFKRGHAENGLFLFTKFLEERNDLKAAILIFWWTALTHNQLGVVFAQHLTQVH